MSGESWIQIHANPLCVIFRVLPVLLCQQHLVLPFIYRQFLLIKLHLQYYKNVYAVTYVAIHTKGIFLLSIRGTDWDKQISGPQGHSFLKVIVPYPKLVDLKGEWCDQWAKCCRGAITPTNKILARIFWVSFSVIFQEISGLFLRDFWTNHPTDWWQNNRLHPNKNTTLFSSIRGNIHTCQI